jgi:hypothetical protein
MTPVLKTFLTVYNRLYKSVFLPFIEWTKQGINISGFCTLKYRKGWMDGRANRPRGC